MPSYVYMTNKVGVDIGLSLAFTGPDTRLEDHFTLKHASLAVDATNYNVLTIDRTDSPFSRETMTVAELRISIGPTFIAAVEIILANDGAIVTSMQWAWRTAELATGIFVDNYDLQTVSIRIEDSTLVLTLQGVDAIGFDDLNITLSGHWMQVPLQASLYDSIDAPLTVNRFTGSGRDTPGNVGVCLSGGGSRAMTAGMGQLAGLAVLGLLSKIKAISTVSGGSWVGVTWNYLKDGTSETDLLGSYVAPGALTSPGIANLPAKSLGNYISNASFSRTGLALQAWALYVHGTPPDMIWQTLIGIHILQPYGLFKPSGKSLRPTSLFSADQATLEKDVTSSSLNPSLANVPADLQTLGRPFLICNTAMFIKSEGVDALAPVQATPYFTGVIGTPNGADANGKESGGGGVTSFAFSSELQTVASSKVQVLQNRQWSLADIVGASSAFFAGYLGSAMADVDALAAYALDHGTAALDGLEGYIDEQTMLKIHGIVERANKHEFAEVLALPRPQDLVPRYIYWPVRNAAPEPQAKPSMFADGGNLENTGITSLLAYQDVDSIIAFVNSQTPLAAGNKGIIDGSGNEIPNTRVVVDEQIPPLFGYQPYQAGVGYVLYGGSGSDYKSRSKVFLPSDFAALLQGLWNASGMGAAKPATFVQVLAVQANTWFGVPARSSVKVLWSYLNPVDAWQRQLSSDVASQIPQGFPSYSVFTTQLTAQQINLMTSLTGWCVCDPSNSSPFTALFS